MVKTIDHRVSGLELILEDLPAILNLRFGQAKAERDEIKAQLAGVTGQVADIRAQVSRLSVGIDELRLEVRTLPRVLAEMLDERERRS